MASAGVHQWTDEMQELYSDEVIGPLWKDPRTNVGKSVWLGYPFDVVREDVISKGLADFQTGCAHSEYGKLTADDKVLLYCLVNMRLHYFEAAAAFESHKPRLKSLFDGDRKTVMADLGCGPGTAGLALCECFKQPDVVYFGLDISKAMLRKAESMLLSAQKRKLLGAKSKVLTTTSWASLAKLPQALSRPANVLFNATYLFASDSLDVGDVCKAVMACKQSTSVKDLLFLYSNTTTK